MRFLGVPYWVQLQTDLKEFERSSLHCGRRGQHIEDLLAHADSIACERRQVHQETSEAMYRQPLGGLFASLDFRASSFR